MIQRKIPLNSDLKIGHEIGAPFDQEDRETDGAVHWDTINPKLLRAFGYQGARYISERDWLQYKIKWFIDSCHFRS